MRGIGCMYKLYDHGRYLGIYDSAGIERITGLPRNRVNRYARNQWKYSRRYRIIFADNCEMKKRRMRK